jgi:hypothetical protein
VQRPAATDAGSAVDLGIDGLGDDPGSDIGVAVGCGRRTGAAVWAVSGVLAVPVVPVVPVVAVVPRASGSRWVMVGPSVGMSPRHSERRRGDQDAVRIRIEQQTASRLWTTRGCG